MATMNGHDGIGDPVPVPGGFTALDTAAGMTRREAGALCDLSLRAFWATPRLSNNPRATGTLSRILAAMSAARGIFLALSSHGHGRCWACAHVKRFEIRTKTANESVAAGMAAEWEIGAWCTGFSIVWMTAEELIHGTCTEFERDENAEGPRTDG